MRARMTIADLARAVHVARPTVSLWESGRRRPARHHWPALAAALDLEPVQVGHLFPDHPSARLDTQRLPGLAAQQRRRGLTQAMLAARVRVAPSTLAMWETRHVPVPLGTVHHLARVLHSDAARLSAPALESVSPDPRPLRRYRRRAGLSQREAAAYLGISLASLARYEADLRRPSVTTARAMAATYRQSFDDIAAACGIALPSGPGGFPGIRARGPWHPRGPPGRGVDRRCTGTRRAQVRPVGPRVGNRPAPAGQRNLPPPRIRPPPHGRDDPAHGGVTISTASGAPQLDPHGPRHDDDCIRTTVFHAGPYKTVSDVE
jgi:transcriptional regulator with XRE-family HTH domain